MPKPDKDAEPGSTCVIKQESAYEMVPYANKNGIVVAAGYVGYIIIDALDKLAGKY
jgi:hypothetical protein